MKFNFIRTKCVSVWKRIKSVSKKPSLPNNLQSVTRIHGIERVDLFGKLRLDSRAGIEYMQAELKLFERILDKYHGLLGEINLIRELASSVVAGSSEEEEVVVEGDKFVVIRDRDGTYFWKHKLTSKKVVLLWANDIDSLGQLLNSKPTSYVTSSKVKLVKLQVSSDLRFMGVIISLVSEEVGTLFIIDRKPTETIAGLKVIVGQQSCDILQVLPNVFNFLLVNQNIMFTQVNQQLRPYLVQFFCLTQLKTTQLFCELETSNFVDIGLTRDQCYVTINSNSLTSSTIRICATNNLSQLYLFHQPSMGVECFVDHVKDKFVILSNCKRKENNCQFQLYTIQDKPLLLNNLHNSNQTWVNKAQLVELGLGENFTITDVELFLNYALVYGLDSNTNSQLAVYNWQTQKLTTILNLPGSATIQPTGQAQGFESELTSIRICSPVIPPQLITINLSKATLSSKIHSLPVHNTSSTYKNSNFSTGYHVHKFKTPPYQTSPAIPITWIESKHSQANHNAPVLMVGYGAYGMNLLPEFRPHYFPLIHRGWKVALVHIRGGSELGSQWYEQGRGTHKLNSSLDFLSAARYFKSQSSVRHLVASASSAGAVAVAGAVHRQPELFKVMTLRVPFLNVLDSMLDPSSPLTEVEYGEWGNPTQHREDLENILNYAPYDTLSQVSESCPFPATLIMSGLQDLRVNPLDSLKYLANLRHRFPELPSNHFLLQMNQSDGHQISDPNKYYQSSAQELDFILKHTS